eukprot:SAG31_NODE_18376_length_638_cov_1.328386_1_plen_158_part_01
MLESITSVVSDLQKQWARTTREQLMPVACATLCGSALVAVTLQLVLSPSAVKGKSNSKTHVSSAPKRKAKEPANIVESKSESAESKETAPTDSNLFALPNQGIEHPDSAERSVAFLAHAVEVLLAADLAARSGAEVDQRILGLLAQIRSAVPECSSME